jgi:hypothetical protein
MTHSNPAGRKPASLSHNNASTLGKLAAFGNDLSFQHSSLVSSGRAGLESQMIHSAVK